jgi:hypothetical protein
MTRELQREGSLLFASVHHAFGAGVATSVVHFTAYVDFVINTAANWTQSGADPEEAA